MYPSAITRELVGGIASCVFFELPVTGFPSHICSTHHDVGYSDYSSLNLLCLSNNSSLDLLCLLNSYTACSGTQPDMCRVVVCHVISLHIRGVY